MLTPPIQKGKSVIKNIIGNPKVNKKCILDYYTNTVDGPSMTVVEVIIVEEAQTPSAAAIVVEFPVEVAVRRQEVERMVLVEPGRVVTEEEEEVMTVEPVIVVNRVPVAEV